MPDTKVDSFFDAIRNGDEVRVKALLDTDPSLASAKNNNNISAVLMSAYMGRRDLSKLLIERGASLELHEAAAAGNLEIVKSMVEKKRLLAQAISPDGFPIVALAAAFGHEEVVRYLVAQGADINAATTNGSGYNALTGAVTNGHTRIVQWLLESGANANYRYGPGYSPLHAAAANGHLEIAKLLFKHGADKTAVTNDGKSAVDLAAERNHPDLVEFLKTS